MSWNFMTWQYTSKQHKKPINHTLMGNAWHVSSLYYSLLWCALDSTRARERFSTSIKFCRTEMESVENSFQNKCFISSFEGFTFPVLNRKYIFLKYLFVSILEAGSLRVYLLNFIIFFFFFKKQLLHCNKLMSRKKKMKNPSTMYKF